MTRAVDLRALRDSLGRLTRGELLIVAQRAVEMVPDTALPLLMGGLVELQPDSEAAPGTAALLKEVRRFHTEGVSGTFYESFAVNSRNCSEQSRGTDAFIAEFDRLVVECVSAALAEPGQVTAQAFEVLFSLLRYIDEGNDDVLFFADEGGSWSVGVDWSRALPAYFLCLAQSASGEVPGSGNRSGRCRIPRARPCRSCGHGTGATAGPHGEGVAGEVPRSTLGA